MTARTLLAREWMCPACRVERCDYEAPDRHLPECPNCGVDAAPVEHIGYRYPGYDTVTVIDSGNVSVSAALAIMLAARRPDLHVYSAAVGRRARPGRPMAVPMVHLMRAHQAAALAHRSRKLDSIANPGLIVCPTALLARHVPDGWPCIILDPPIPGPAFSGPAAYRRAHTLASVHAAALAAQIGPA